MSYAIGIDLGTTNSVVSIYRRGIAETQNIDGRSTMPSVVSFRPDGTILVGKTAKSRLLLDPENTIASAKRDIGDRSTTYSVGGKTLSPVNVSSIIIKDIVAGAKKSLGEDIWDAVITVPAYFTEAQKEDTKRAGEEAGLNVLRLLPEPTAAAIAYGLDQEKDQTLMVYDLGGGTFDVSILEIVNNNFQVKAVGGDSRLGGDDFDLAIMTWASQKFQAETGIDLLGNSSKAGKVARQRLKEAAETAKIELSQAKSAILAVPDCLGHPLEQEISLSEYNELIAPLLQKTVDCMKSVLRDAGLDADDIDRVILVGGSTKNQAVQEIVTREIKEPFVAERVDEVVSHGAAIVAANLSLPDAVDIEFSDVTAHSLGVDMLDLDNKIFFQPIITRNTTYPCRKGMLAYSNRPHQKEVKMNVFRGEDHDPKKNMGLGELTLPISPPQPEQIPIAAIFDLDADGIIHFTAVQLPLGKLSDSIVQYATEQNSALDIPAVEALIASGQAKSTTISVNSKQP